MLFCSVVKQDAMKSFKSSNIYTTKCHPGMSLSFLFFLQNLLHYALTVDTYVEVHTGIYS